VLTVEIPGRPTLRLEHLVLDFNGTLACDGALLPGVRERLTALAQDLTVHVLTADTFGKAAAELDGCPVALTVLPADAQDEAKAAAVRRLGSASVVAIGNGRNDRLMLAEAALGIAVVLAEGAAGETLHAADVVCTDIGAALDLLANPLRLAATLRS
jgi:soluble P-type ATPase